MPDIIKYVRWGLSLPVYYASCLIPRNKNLWVFGSWYGQRFSDNSKHLFLYTKRNHPEIRAVWLTHNRKIAQELSKQGYEAYTALSLKGFLHSLRAGCVIVSCGLVDVNQYVVGGAKKIQLWHGTPLKKVGYDCEVSFLSGLSGRRAVDKLRMLIVLVASKVDVDRLRSFDAFIATSEESRRTLASAFRASSNRVHVTGYPRNDALTNTEWPSSDISGFLDSIKSQVAYEHVFTYLPTFRDSRQGNPDLLARYKFDTNAVQETLERLNAILIMKGHYIDNKIDLPCDDKTPQRIYTPSDEELPDVYPLLRETDILITDYSSVYFDYLILNRPIVFAPFDIDDYVRNDRALHYDYDEVTPGPKARDWLEVFKLVEEAVREDRWKQQREAVCNRFNAFRDNKSSERVFRLMQEMLS